MVDSELGEIPKGWKVGKLGECGTFKNGINYLRNETGDTESREKIPVFRRIFFVLLAILLCAAWLSYAIYLPHVSFRGEKTVEVPRGFGSRKIGEFLKKEGVIGSKWAFVIHAALKAEASNLKPGVYVFSEQSTISEILANLVSGEEYPNERFLVIPEGWNLRDIGNYFERQGIAEARGFWKVAGLPAADYRTMDMAEPPPDFSNNFPPLRAKPNYVGLEGFLFPDTYRVYRDASAKEIIEKMLLNFERKFDEGLRQAAASQKKSAFEIVTLASLIEKEVRSDEDRKLISGILWKRLALGIPLQVDATLTYIKGHNSAPLTNGDKASPSRFNTYRYQGLPAGPIANPGLSAIRAALYPAESAYLYYLSAPDGRTIFSRTLEEHNAAKAKHLR